ncbi:hypothetical protein [Dietzia timorensis]|uniref:Uncharacterized protein n=1 Tax=Dietzia timorensis TaxID=499555 RepID=A0A173LHC8_9ACTN|nr:hypothetical protein [Dietzia timorensis]ANI91665.1 Hypothetical protein BJL86_0871 [Dietzia timorensis]
MAKKFGRVRCGSCDRVIYDPGQGFRTPRPQEQAELDAMEPSLESGAALYRAISGGGALDAHTRITFEDDAQTVALFQCAGKGCGIRYRVEGYPAQLADAIARTADLVLFHSQRT